MLGFNGNNKLHIDCLQASLKLHIWCGWVSVILLDLVDWCFLFILIVVGLVVSTIGKVSVL